MNTGAPLWHRTTISGIRNLDDPEGHDLIVSMLDPEWPEPDDFDRWPTERRAMFRFHDEIAPRTDKDRVLPDAKLVDALITFGRQHDLSRASLFIHCQSGVSRSTAGALILWALSAPDVAARDLFAALKAIRPVAWPNTLMLALADEALGRTDRLADAAVDLFREAVAAPGGDELAKKMFKLRRVADLEAIGALPQAD